ncbi:hypothetical protein GF343_04375 [Candidatus Woesearchaeota archaeon]|nr:hypothetical protein [Candidatus Woesearchaeota archaeon]
MIFSQYAIWAKRKKTELTPEEFDAIVPQLTMKDMAAVAKQVSEEAGPNAGLYKNSAYKAFCRYKTLRNEYKTAVTARKCEFSASETEPAGESAE